MKAGELKNGEYITTEDETYTVLKTDEIVTLLGNKGHILELENDSTISEQLLTYREDEPSY